MSGSSATATLSSPIGLILVEAVGDVLTHLRIDPAGGSDHLPQGHKLLADTVKQLQQWFAGKRENFDLPLQPLPSERGNTLRQGMADIPYGETMTYGELARRLDSAPRAIGQACRRNPFPILIPCHRVVSSSGPEYYSGGDGPNTKAWLITFEQRRTRLL